MIDKETVEKMAEFLGEELLREEDWELVIDSPTSGPTSEGTSEVSS